MNKSILIFCLSALLASAATYTGVITDSMCVGDHKRMNMGPDADCVRKCVQAHGSARYVLFDGKNAYKLSDQQTPEKYAARKVKVTGKLFEKTGVIAVEKIEPAN